MSENYQSNLTQELKNYTLRLLVSIPLTVALLVINIVELLTSNINVIFIILNFIIIGIMLAYQLVTTLSLSKLNKHYRAKSKEYLFEMIKNHQSQLKIIITFIDILEKIKDMEGDRELGVMFDSIEETSLKLKALLESSTRYSENLELDIINQNELEEHLIKITDCFLKIAPISDSFANRFSLTYQHYKDTIAKRDYNIAKLLYYLGNSTPIMADLSKIFNEFSKSIVVDVINKFGEISNSSHKITKDIQDTMNSLMDESNADSLAFIIKKAHDIVLDFENFVTNMEHLKTSSRRFMENSVEKLKHIQGIATSIEEIAQTIKVISLNVSIEAANAGNTGKGFQVLARDLREFATATLKFAQDVKNSVRDTLETTDQLKDEYMDNMDNVYKYIGEIKHSIQSFEDIIKNTFYKIKEIITNLQVFSNNIDNGIKEVVGKLQYYDITSQEVEHLAMFVQRIFVDLFNANNEIRITEILTDPEKVEVKTSILKLINEIITTSSERKIFEKYEQIFEVKISDDIKIDNKASIDMKGDKDEIIIF